MPGSGAVLSRLPLLDLYSELVPVRYSAGSLQRASNLQDPFELLTSDFRRWSGTPAQLAVLLLNRDEWTQAGFALPYGLPMRSSGAAVATAAWGDGETVDLWRGLLGWSLPTVEESPLRSTAEEAASLLPGDLLGLFEGARLLVENAGYSGSESWVGDVVSHTLALTVVARGFVGGLGEADRFYQNLAADRPARPLAEYGPGLSLEDWLWFQSRFYGAARAILDSERRGTGKSIVKLIRKHEGHLSVGELVGRYPSLSAWIAESFPTNEG